MQTDGGPAQSSGSVEVLQLDAPCDVIPSGIAPPAPSDPSGPAGSGALIFRGGATSAGNVVGNAADLKAALVLNPAAVVFVDSSMAPCTITAGIVIDGLNQTVLTGLRPAGGDKLVIADGATVRGIRQVSGQLTMLCQSGASGQPSIDFDYANDGTGQPAARLLLTDGASISMDATATAPAIVVSAGNQLEILGSELSGLDNSAAPAVPVINLGTTGKMQMVTFGGFSWNGVNQIVSGIGATFEQILDAISAPNPSSGLAGGGTFVRPSTSTQITMYAGGVAPTPPNGLRAGDVWWNTGSNQPSWWNGAAWVAATVV